MCLCDAPVVGQVSKQLNCALVPDWGRRALALERACGPVSVRLRLSWMQQTWPQKAAVDRVPENCPEPAQLPKRPRTAHHPGRRMGWEREVSPMNPRRPSTWVPSRTLAAQANQKGGLLVSVSVWSSHVTPLNRPDPMENPKLSGQPGHFRL